MKLEVGQVWIDRLGKKDKAIVVEVLPNGNGIVDYYEDIYRDIPIETMGDLFNFSLEETVKSRFQEDLENLLNEKS